MTSKRGGQVAVLPVVELFDRIRRDSWQSGLSIRALSKKYGVHRRLMREDCPRRCRRRGSGRCGPGRGWSRTKRRSTSGCGRTSKCRASSGTPRSGIGTRLEEEFGVTLPYTTARDFVTVRRRAITEEGGAAAEGYLIRHNAPGRGRGGGLRGGANPNVDPAVIHNLATCDRITKGYPLCPIRDSGTDKSHLLIGLGTAAATAGYRVRYTTAASLVNELVEAADD